MIMDKERTVSVYVNELLDEIGMNAGLEGRKEIIIGMQLVLEDGFEFHHLKELYLEIAKIRGKSIGNIEKNIRVAIEYAFTKGAWTTVYGLYKDIIKFDRGKPMAQYFIPKTIEILQERMKADQ